MKGALLKILIITTPIRPDPTNYPPVGSLSLVKYLRTHGCADVEFYNIDGARPSYAEALKYIADAKPDVLGISAVVSTAYEYTKRLSLDIKKLCPNTLIVVGGNLAASAEVLLRCTGADLCVLAEGEKVLLNIVRRVEETRDPTLFEDITGIVYLSQDDELINTGYESQLEADAVNKFDWEDLEQACDIGIFFKPVFDELGEPVHGFKHDPRTYEESRRNKTHAIVPSSKGCVARCTFCHRWDKGMRYPSIQEYMQKLDTLIEKYNLGFLAVGGENFGTDKRWLAEFCEEVKKRDILWTVGAARTRTVDQDLVDMMMDAGCVNVTFGVESGSPRMLEIMEKKCSLEHNISAMKLAVENNMPSIVQLVIGMPGESPDTIRETIDFCKTVFTLSPNANPNDTSVNYAQALPGTPLYEYGRFKGLIGRTMDEEESYLLSISDKDAHDEISTLNFTDFPTLEFQTWRPRITIETNYAYVMKFGLPHYHKILLKDARFFKRARPDDGYFANPRRLMDATLATDSINDVRESYEIDENQNLIPGLWTLMRSRNFGLAMVCYPILFYRLRALLPLMILARNLLGRPFSQNLNLLKDYARYKILPKNALEKFDFQYISLRKIVDSEIGLLPDDNPVLSPLRKGR
jgi:anaerobic magnesium-protoporphyrin IX monomethyl ester cyclase